MSAIFSEVGKVISTAPVQPGTILVTGANGAGTPRRFIFSGFKYGGKTETTVTKSLFDTVFVNKFGRGLGSLVLLGYVAPAVCGSSGRSYDGIFGQTKRYIDQSLSAESAIVTVAVYGTAIRCVLHAMDVQEIQDGASASVMTFSMVLTAVE